MKKYVILMLVVILFSGVIAGSVFAQNSSTGMGTVPARPELTAAQKAQIAEIQRIARLAVAAAKTPAEKLAIMRQMQADIQAVLAQGQQRPTQKPVIVPRPIAEKIRKAIDRRENCMQSLDLSEDQTAAMDAIRLAAMEAAKAAQSREELQNIMEKMHEDLMAVLTEDQLAALEQCRADNRDPNRPAVGNCMQELNLTEGQKADMDAIRLAAIDAAKAAATRQERQEIFEQMQEDLIGVLDPNQLAQLKECRENDRADLQKRFAHFDRCLKKLDLSEEQLAVIKTIRAEARKALMAAKSREERQAILKQMHDDIINVLTEEQLAKLKECLRLPLPPVTPLKAVR